MSWLTYLLRRIAPKSKEAILSESQQFIRRVVDDTEDKLAAEENELSKVLDKENEDDWKSGTIVAKAEEKYEAAEQRWSHARMKKEWEKRNYGEKA